MKTIFKYNFEISDIVEIQMPKGSNLLTAEIQHGKPALWACVDPDMPLVKVRLAIYGTGHQLPENPGNYFSTLQMYDGRAIFHIFNLGEV